MKALIQRVSGAEVKLGTDVFSRIGKGMLIFLGVEKGDSRRDLEYLVRKVINLRIFEDEQKRMNRSIYEIGGEILVVSQFTLLADCRKGNRPSFDAAEDPIRAHELYEHFVTMLKAVGVKVKTGDFGSYMKVSLVNDGPVTILLDSKKNADLSMPSSPSTHSHR